MRLALVQFAPEFPGREANWRRILSWAERTDADIIVFPELSSCGYCYHDREEIRKYTDRAAVLAPLEEIARRRGRLIIGGFAEEAEDGLHNSAYVIRPDGTDIYRKVHLWNYEKEIFHAGDRPLTVEFQGHRLGLEICYDLQFPEMASAYSRAGVEALLIPTAWAKEAKGPGDLEPYTYLAIATAYSHGMFVAVCNRTGVERGADFRGESSVVDPYGRIQHLGPEEGVLTAELDFGLLEGAKRPTPRNDLDRDGRMTIGALAPSPVRPA